MGSIPIAGKKYFLQTLLLDFMDVSRRSSVGQSVGLINPRSWVQSPSLVSTTFLQSLLTVVAIDFLFAISSSCCRRCDYATASSKAACCLRMFVAPGPLVIIVCAGYGPSFFLTTFHNSSLSLTRSLLECPCSQCGGHSLQTVNRRLPIVVHIRMKR